MSLENLLSTNDKEEQLSRAYVYAVATMAGCLVSQTNIDREGIDLYLNSGGVNRPSIGLQLKATVNLRGEDGNFSFPLKVGNYNQLREQPLMVPRLLVVLRLPEDATEWLNITNERLVLKRCAYWLNLKGFDETNNAATVSVQIPSSNIFDVDAVQALMERARAGKHL